MKVTIAVFGRFHAFDLAQQLEERGVLHCLITSYPKSQTRKFGIPDHKVINIIYLEIFNRVWAKISNLCSLKRTRLQFLFHELFDRFAARHLPKDTNVFIGWSSGSAHTINRAKAIGARTILERGSAHILSQMELLHDEYNLYCNKSRDHITHPKIIPKELSEYEMADYISVPSTFAKNSFIKRGFPDKKIFLNPYGVNLKSFTKSPITRADNLDMFRIIFAGQLSLQKGVHYLLQAFSELKLPNSELCLLGSISSDIIPTLNKYKGYYKFHGHVPQEELKKHYLESDVFCLLSIQEGFGMVILQAMACGLPVICTENTAGVDVITDKIDGFIVPIRDVNLVKEKIRWMYNNKVRTKEMGKNASRKVNQGFSWNDYGNRYFEFLKTM